MLRMAKLTLSVDEHVVASAKRYAEARGTSVSRLVQTMLELVSAAPTHTPGKRGAPPVLARLRGSLERGSVSEHRRHLERKYR